MIQSERALLSARGKDPLGSAVPNRVWLDADLRSVAAQWLGPEECSQNSVDQLPGNACRSEMLSSLLVLRYSALETQPVTVFGFISRDLRYQRHIYVRWSGYDFGSGPETAIAVAPSYLIGGHEDLAAAFLRHCRLDPHVQQRFTRGSVSAGLQVLEIPRSGWSADNRTSDTQRILSKSTLFALPT